MVVFGGASRAGSGRSSFEGPTWLALAGCYILWLATVWAVPWLGWWLCAVPGALAVAFHSSLQHEVLHGHPTRNALINEALVFPAVGLFIPYRRFRDTHLKHHNDERLTDPYDDPESFYLPVGTWERGCSMTRALLAFNGTFAGRMLIGPALAMWGFWRAEWRLVRAGDRAVQGAWLRHVLGLIPVIAILTWAGVPLWAYVLGWAYPGMSLIMVRSYIEHRADDSPDRRSAIVESCWFWRLLFLNNNFHAVHHDRPAVAWYRIPGLWSSERVRVLDRNGGYYLSGYGDVIRRWLWRRREPVVHPMHHRDTADG